MAVSIGGIGKFKRNKGVMTWTIIAWAFLEHLIRKGGSDERRQKLVENDPLIVPPQLSCGFVEHATFGHSSPPSVIDKRIVSFQHSEVQLRDQHVRIVARSPMIAVPSAFRCMSVPSRPIRNFAGSSRL